MRTELPAALGRTVSRTAAREPERTGHAGDAGVAPVFSRRRAGAAAGTAAAGMADRSRRTSGAGGADTAGLALRAGEGDRRGATGSLFLGLGWRSDIALAGSGRDRARGALQLPAYLRAGGAGLLLRRAPVRRARRPQSQRRGG